MPSDFTLAQADDLARYFLGPDWEADIAPDEVAPIFILRKDHLVCRGRGWREVFRTAGVYLPLRLRYVAWGVRVMLADRAICTAVSNTLAKRIAAALNNHFPDRRGI